MATLDELQGSLTGLHTGEQAAIAAVSAVQARVDAATAAVATAFAAGDIPAATKANGDLQAAQSDLAPANDWLDQVRAQIAAVNSEIVQAELAKTRARLVDDAATQRTVLAADIDSIRAAIVNLQSAINVGLGSEQRLGLLLQEIASVSTFVAADGQIHAPRAESSGSPVTGVLNMVGPLRDIRLIETDRLF
jgi:hypothetical protein